MWRSAEVAILPRLGVPSATTVNLAFEAQANCSKKYQQRKQAILKNGCCARIRLPTTMACQFEEKMKQLSLSWILLLALFLSASSFADETIVLVRHGEKPTSGLGQLSCQGFNRALALTNVLQKRFDRPTAIFAPNPGVLKNDQGQVYNYVRPLATIEPTAIALGLPVDTQYGFEDIKHLQEALASPAYKDATIFVAWEHRLLEQVTRNLISANGGDPDVVPVWTDYDFDSIYIVSLKSDRDGRRTATFKLDFERLNRMPTACPGQPAI